MTRKSVEKRQSIERFKAAAKAVGASDDPADFDRMLGEIAKAPPPDTVQDRKPTKAKKPKKPAK